MNTLKDLAEHCYQHWLAPGEPRLPVGSIDWMRDGLGEPVLAGQIEEIFSAAIQPSEKCYRFLKLTGAIEKERLVQLLRKQILDEFDNDRTQRLREVDEQWQARVGEQRQRIFNKPTDKAFSFLWFAIFTAIIGGIIGAIVGRVSESISVNIGWRVGLLIGALVAYGYRRIRVSTLIGQFISSAREGLETQRKTIVETVQDNKVNIDSDMPALIQLFSQPLGESVKREENNPHSTNTSLSAEISLNKRYAALVAVLCLLLSFSPSLMFSDIGNNTIEEASSAPKTVLTNLPFEGFQFGKWTAKESLPAYLSEGNSSQVAFTVEPNEEITAISSTVYVDHIGIAKVNENIQPDLCNDSPNKEFYSQRGLKKGDIIGVIFSPGEGCVYVWVKGKVGCVCNFHPGPDYDKPNGSWVKKYDDIFSLWVKVKNGHDEMGWIHLETPADFTKLVGWNGYEGKDF